MIRRNQLPNLSALLFAALLSTACDSRFPTCKDNAECEKSTEGKARVCYNLKCVECHYDTDCPAGKTCNGTLNTCEGLDNRPKEEAAAIPSVVEQAKYEPGNWDDCARDCKDPECIKKCDAKFPKGAGSAAPSAKPPAAKKPGAK